MPGEIVNNTRTSPWVDTNDGSIRWHQGDTVEIQFDIDVTVDTNDVSLDANTYLDTADFIVELLDIRREAIISYTQRGLIDGMLSFKLNVADSARVSKGKYSLKVRVIKGEDFAQTLIGEKVINIVVE